ncbi:MAG: septum formation family protein [Chloroflexi bacterium]|nr:septum formation family protein [Chloroflexota bacterium]
MARVRERQPDDHAARPNVLSDGNPIPNVLRGEVRPHAPEAGSQSPPPARRRRRPTLPVSARAAAGERARTAEGRRPDEQPPPRTTRPGCGCGGWLGLLVLFYLASQLLGSCDQLLAPQTGAGELGSSRSGAIVDWHDLQAGDCFDWPEDEEGFGDLPLVDCAVAHDVEVTGALDLDDGAGAVYDEEAVGRAAEMGCWSVYSAYTGEPALVSEGSELELLYPGTEAAWRAGDRTVICLAVGDGPDPLAGSVRTTGAP